MKRRSAFSAEVASMRARVSQRIRSVDATRVKIQEAVVTPIKPSVSGGVCVSVYVTGLRV
jgi:hypothetical protein